MVSSCSNVQYENYLEHKLSFKLKISEDNGSSNSCWTTKSPDLHLYDDRQCNLQVSCRMGYGSYGSWNHSFVMSLKAVKDFCFKATENITLYVYFENTNQKHTFYMTKVNNKEFKYETTLSFNRSSLSGESISFEITFARESISPDLIKDFASLLNNGEHNDLTIKVNEKDFKVHKNIVSKRNEILAKMIKVDMLEKKTNEISLNDYDPDTVKTFLKFIYTGTCDVANNNVELFRLAHFLQQSDLQEIIKAYMIKNINLDNFVVLFEVADLYELQDLHVAVDKFFCANKDKCVKYPTFESYLRKSIKLSNIKFVLEIAHAYKLEETLRDAMEFVRNNYKDIVKISENRTYIQENYNLLFKLFEHAVGYSPDDPQK